mgnify:CR=1 FL=1
MQKFGIIEFECFLIVIFMLLDIILGSIDHIWYQHNSSSRDAIRSIFTKLGISAFLIIILLVLHSNDKGFFTPDIIPVLNMCKNAANVIVIMLLYYELTSLLAHLHNITGLDFSKVPGVKGEINNKYLSSYEYDEKLRKMKEHNND